MLQISRRISELHTYYQCVASPPYMVTFIRQNPRGSSAQKVSSGRLADILGRKGAMLLALTLFGESPSK